jgi:hypothetical protein
MTAMTLSEVLYALGWGHVPADSHGRRTVHDHDGVIVGDLTAGETWALLRERGLYDDSLGCSSTVEHATLTRVVGGSNPPIRTDA